MIGNLVCLNAVIEILIEYKAFHLLSIHYFEYYLTENYAFRQNQTFVPSITNITLSAGQSASVIGKKIASIAIGTVICS